MGSNILSASTHTYLGLFIFMTKEQKTITTRAIQAIGQAVEINQGNKFEVSVEFSGAGNHFEFRAYDSHDGGKEVFYKTVGLIGSDADEAMDEVEEVLSSLAAGLKPRTAVH